MSYTKEQWYFEATGWTVNPYRVVVRKRGVHSVAVANCPAKATISLEEAKANARLIAAAPELLETLKEVTRCLSWHEQRHGVAMDSKALQSARAIIFKADEIF